MRRPVLMLALAPLALACTIQTPEEDLGFATGMTGAGPATTGDDSGMDPDEGGSTGGVDPGGSTGDAGASTGGDDPGTGGDGGGSTGGDGGSTGGSSGGVGDSTGGGSTGGGSTGGAPNTPQPDNGAWSHCLITDDCNDAALGCLNNGGAMQPTDGVCTMACAAANDPSNCPTAPPAVAATLGCVLVNTTPVCALFCQADLDCPGGMVCQEEESDNGVVTVCM